MAVGEKSSSKASSRSKSGAAAISIAGHRLPKHVLHAIEEIALVLPAVLSAGARLELFFRQHFGELIEELPLFPRELLRGEHLHGREQIAASAAAHVGQPLAAQSKRRAGLRPLRNLDGLGRVERRHLNLAAERRGREVHRNLAEQVQAVAAKKLVLLHMDDDVEMARRAAAGSSFAFGLEPELLARRNAGRDLDGDLSFTRHAAGAAARLAGPADDPSGALALRARARDREEALLVAHLPLPAALRADSGRGPGRRA